VHENAKIKEKQKWQKKIGTLGSLAVQIRRAVPPTRRVRHFFSWHNFLLCCVCPKLENKLINYYRFCVETQRFFYSGIFFLVAKKIKGRKCRNHQFSFFLIYEFVIKKLYMVCGFGSIRNITVYRNELEVNSIFSFLAVFQSGKKLQRTNFVRNRIFCWQKFKIFLTNWNLWENRNFPKNAFFLKIKFVRKIEFFPKN